MMNMNLLDKLLQYKELEDEIFEAFDYEHDWRVFPLVLELDRYWFVAGLGNNTFVTSEHPFTEKLIENEEIYTAEIYMYCHLKQYVWRTETHTMALLDTECDNNVWLIVFDNEKECKDKRLIALFNE